MYHKDCVIGTAQGAWREWEAEEVGVLEEGQQGDAGWGTTAGHWQRAIGTACNIPAAHVIQAAVCRMLCSRHAAALNCSLQCMIVACSA